MNTDNLKKIVEILKSADPGKFDMQRIFDMPTEKSCVIGYVFKHFHPDYKARDLNAEMEAVIFFDKFSRLPSFISNARSYIVMGEWAEYPQTNTIEHAIYRIEKVINGYKPEYFEYEIEKELELLN